MKRLLYIALLFSAVAKGQSVQINPDRFRSVYPIDGKRPVHLILDGSTATDNWFGSDFTESGFVLPNDAYIDLGAIYSQVKIEYYNQFAGGATQPTFTLYNDARTDSLTVSPSSTPIGGYRWVDTVTTKAAPFNPRWLKIRQTQFAETKEVRVYGVLSSTAASPYQTGVAQPSDPGIYHQGVGLLGDEDTVYIKEAASYRITHANWWSADDKTAAFASQPYKFQKYRDEAVLLNYLKRMGWRSVRYSKGASAAARPSYLPASPTFNQYTAALDYNKDIPQGSDSTAVENWNLNMKPFWQATAYLFGSNTSATAPAGHVLSGTTIVAGRNLLNAAELWNEDDGTWKGDSGYHRPQVSIVKAKAGYDGVKAADPNMPVYLGAMTNFDSTRLKGIFILSYFKYGKGVFPFDGIAFNQYITDARGPQPQGFNTNSGISPERFDVYTFTRKVMEFRNTYFPGKKMWWTEINYATNTNSNYDVPVIGGTTVRRTQADWLIRVYELATIKQTADSVAMDGIYAYWHKDDGTNDFGTMNLVTANFDGGGVYVNSTPHEAWYWMTTRKNLLWNAKGWSSLIQHGDSTGTWITKRLNLTGDTAFYCVWRGTSSNSTVTNLSLPLPDAVGSTATLIQMVSGDEDGLPTALTISGGAVTIPTVNETPLYVKVPVNIGGGGPSLPTPASSSNILKTRFRKVKNL